MVPRLEAGSLRRGAGIDQREQPVALGEVTGRLHTALASDAQDPAFAPEDTSTEALGLLTATVDEEIEKVFLDLPDDREDLAPIRGRGEEVRERLRMLTQVGSAGRVIRHHGDYHLGQVMHTGDGDWVVLDFEGEPARTLIERRRKRSPLRDVAGMLRSFSYAKWSARDKERTVTRDSDDLDAWEAEVRQAFLKAYAEASKGSGLFTSFDDVKGLLTLFELEKVLYELRYEINNRPAWIHVPLAGVMGMLGGAR